MQTGSRPPTFATPNAEGTQTCNIETDRTIKPPTRPLNASSLPCQEHGVNHHLDGEDWELNADYLPAGTSLPGSKALMDDYPDDETSYKKTKKKKTGKRAKGNNKSKT